MKLTPLVFKAEDYAELSPLYGMPSVRLFSPISPCGLSSCNSPVGLFSFQAHLCPYYLL